MTAERLDKLLQRGAPGQTAIIAGDDSLDYATLDDRVSAVAGALAGRVAPGEQVALWLPKSLDFVVLLLAVLRAGAVAVPINPVLRGPQVQHILRDAGASLLLTQPARARLLVDAPCPILTAADWQSWFAHPAIAPSAAGGDTLAMLLYTSGSTGLPKGVMVSHANLLLGAEIVAGYLGTTANDRVLAVLPFSFDFGLSQLTTALSAGATTVLLDYLAPRDVLLSAERHCITQLAAVPPLWQRIAGLDWPDSVRRNLRTLSNSGGRLPVPTVRVLRRQFPQARLHLMYGLTEAFRSTTLPPELVDAHPDSIGRAIPQAEILVVRPNGTLCDDGEVGELVHCGPLVTGGYWQDAARTALRFRPAPPASRLGGMAVWSGDDVRRDADGLLYFIGRRDEGIKTMGTRVSPTEIEELAQQSGAVAEALAFGVADAIAGQQILLVASLAKGLDEAEAQQRLRQYFRRQAAPYMMPARIIWRPELPLSANGKLDRVRVRREWVDG